MFLEGQTGTEALGLQHTTGGCKRPAKVRCFSFSQGPDYLIAGSLNGQIRQWFGRTVQQGESF
jgi:hypothetical protein